MKLFSIPQGILSYCQFGQDKPEDVVSCCLGLCKEQVTGCYDTCKGNCYRCQEIISSCEDSCLEYTSSLKKGSTLLDAIPKKQDSTPGTSTFPKLFLFLLLLLLLFSFFILFRN